MDYIKRFKQMRDVFVANFGTAMFDAWVEKQEQYKKASTDDEKEKLKENAMEEWTAYMVIRGCDKNKYGTVSETFRSQYSYGTDQYPRTIIAATDALAKHKFDPKYREVKLQRAKQQQLQRERDEARAEASFAQKKKKNSDTADLTCYCCGEKGHNSDKCPKKDVIPRAQWWIKFNQPAVRDVQAHQQEDDDTNDERSVSSAAQRNRRSGTPGR
jgi:hypothetical protein